MDSRLEYPMPFSRITSAIQVTVSPAPDALPDEDHAFERCTDTSVRVDLPGGTRRFEIPDEWLTPGAEYTLDVQVIDADGHLGTHDYRFFTAS